MKKYKVALILMVLVLVSALGAKQYATITMSDDEWIGLGANAGRIVFDDQTNDEVNIMANRVGIGSANTEPSAMLHLDGTFAGNAIRVTRGTHNSAWFAAHDGPAYFGTVSNDDLYLRTNSATRITVKADGSVGFGDTTPSYDVDVAGSVRATDVVQANVVFIGAEEDPEEDAAHMFTRADSANGGYVFWAERDLTDWHSVIFERSDNDGVTGPSMALWVQWLTHCNDTDEFYEGDALLITEVGYGSVYIADTGDGHDLQLVLASPIFEEVKGRVFIAEQGDHSYDVALLMMWIED